MSEHLSQTLEYLIRSGATHELAPDVGADVLDRIDTFLGRFIAYPNVQARHAHVLWIAHTLFMDAWNYTPRLLFISPEAGCGKTFALQLTSLLVPRADHIGDLTPAGLYSSIEESLQDCGARPTILYDEVDTVFGPGRDAKEMRRLLDIGHDRRATVVRKIGKQTVRFQVYCAMALAGKMDPSEVPSTIRTRSVMIRMQPRAPHERVDRWNRRTSPAEAAPLRDQLQLWAEFVHEHAHQHLPDIPEEISNRDADVWEPLLGAADLAGGHWPNTARVAAVAVVAASVAAAEPSRGVRLLWDIKAVFDAQRVDRMFTEKLLTELKSLPESPWRSLNPITMAQLLKRYGVEPENVRIGETVRRGYQRESFRDAWLRYPPPKPSTASRGYQRESFRDAWLRYPPPKPATASESPATASESSDE